MGGKEGESKWLQTILNYFTRASRSSFENQLCNFLTKVSSSKSAVDCNINTISPLRIYISFPDCVKSQGMFVFK